MEKENKRLKILLGTLSVLAMGLCFYFAYTVYNMGDNDCNSKEISTVTNCVNTNYYNLNVKELSKFGTGDISIIKKEGILNYTFTLEVDGRININFLDHISNISNAKDIILFSSPSSDATLYILTKTGDVYKYNTSDYDSGNLTATKINDYSGIDRIINFERRNGNSGGCDYIILIDKNGKYNELDSYCV